MVTPKKQFATRWPYPGDSPVVRARKITWAYRALAEKLQAKLSELDPDAIKEVAPDGTVTDLDARFRQWGERWPAPVRTYDDPDEMINAYEAADLSGIAAGSFSHLRVRGRIKGVLVDGKTFEYRVADVHKLAEEIRTRRQQMADRVGTKDRIVSTEDFDPSQSPPQPATDEETAP